MSIKNIVTSGVLSCMIATSTFVISTAAYAGDAGAFIGGVFATKLLTNMSERTQAEQAQAAAAQRPQYVEVPAAQPSRSAEGRIQELDKLAAGGYITPEQYKQKKQAIIDSM